MAKTGKDKSLRIFLNDHSHKISRNLSVQSREYWLNLQNGLDFNAINLRNMLYALTLNFNLAKVHSKFGHRDICCGIFGSVKEERAH